MNIYKNLPVASDRMGLIWTLATIEDACIIEFGPAGTTHYAVEAMGQLNGEALANVYSTHMSEEDITFGSYDRLVNSIKEVDVNIKPKYIFVLASSVSSVIGCDIEGICIEIGDEVNAKLIPVNIGGLKDDYNFGVEKALDLIVKNIVKPGDEKTDTFNIIGSNIDSFNFLSDCEEIRRIMKSIFNKELNTIFTAYTSIDELEKASKASLNIVLREEGLKAARYMKEKFEIPYMYNKPIGVKQTIEWINAIKDKMDYDINLDNLKEEEKLIKKYINRVKMQVRFFQNKDIAIFGDKDTVLSMKNFMEDLGFNIHRAEVIHNCNVEDKNIIINSGEFNKAKYLKENPLLMILGDGGTLKLKHKSSLDIQISNPNFDEIRINPYNPFVGFRGAIHFIEKILSIKEF
ncbi:MAG: nitrogenase component 1 [Clostridium perfringens]|nr:nitrogenase component 1 [Clostridium perfringens]